MEIHASLWTKLLMMSGISDPHTLLVYDHVISAGIVFLLLSLLALAVNSRKSMVPNHLQQVVEVIVQALMDMMNDTIGAHSRKYLPLIGGLAFFIFTSNFLGLVPSFTPATGNWNTTLACALIVFLYYNFQGFKEHGIKYGKHFMGPELLLSPLMLPIEIISHIARPLSLSIRLFGNISGEHMVMGVFYTQLIPWLVPVPMMALGLFAAVLQTFVFIILAQLYIAEATEHAH